jgi:hypothetical protein
LHRERRGGVGRIAGRAPAREEEAKKKSVNESFSSSTKNTSSLFLSLSSLSLAKPGEDENAAIEDGTLTFLGRDAAAARAAAAAR